MAGWKASNWWLDAAVTVVVGVGAVASAAAGEVDGGGGGGGQFSYLVAAGSLTFLRMRQK